MSKNLKVTTCYHARFFEESNLLTLTKWAHQQTLTCEDLSASHSKAMMALAMQTRHQYLKDITPLINVALLLR